MLYAPRHLTSAAALGISNLTLRVLEAREDDHTLQRDRTQKDRSAATGQVEETCCVLRSDIWIIVQQNIHSSMMSVLRAAPPGTSSGSLETATTATTL